MTRERSRKAVKKEITNDVVPIEELVPYAKNARKHPEKQIDALCKSIAAFGFVNPVSVWKGNELIAGHGRVIAAKRLLETGKPEYAYLAKIPVRRCDHLSDKDRRALALADNQIALQAEWDDDILQEELSDLLDNDIDLSVLGFDPSDVVTVEDDLQDGVQTNAEMSQETVDAANTQAVIGPYRIPIPREVFLKWEEEIRQSVGFDKQEIIKEIKKRLKLKC
jgi:hypothetical protein